MKNFYRPLGETDARTADDPRRGLGPSIQLARRNVALLKEQKATREAAAREAADHIESLLPQ